MKAFTKHKYGGPESLQYEDVEKPEAEEGELLVRVLANSANPADWHLLRGEPKIARLDMGLFRPKEKILGADFAGIVEEVGEGVTEFQKGDRVFGETLNGGAFAEYNAVPASNCATMPEGAAFPEMAAVPIAGVTALQALLKHGKLRDGESVLINGASGGVGHFAVQIAKARGATVTAVCSSGKREFVKSLGAEHLIAYDRENIHAHEGEYNLVLDVHGNLSHEDMKRMGERAVVVGFTTVGHMFKLFLNKFLSRFPVRFFTAKSTTRDLETLAEMIRRNEICVNIEKEYPHTEIPEAIRYIEKMRTKGKVVMKWDL